MSTITGASLVCRCRIADTTPVVTVPKTALCGGALQDAHQVPVELSSISVCTRRVQRPHRAITIDRAMALSKEAPSMSPVSPFSNSGRHTDRSRFICSMTISPTLRPFTREAGCWHSHMTCHMSMQVGASPQQGQMLNLCDIGCPERSSICVCPPASCTTRCLSHCFHIPATYS